MYAWDRMVTVNGIPALIMISLLFSAVFFGIRAEIDSILLYQLNKSAYKKRRKGESAKEWFLYSRFREEIPKAMIRLYFAVLFVHPAAILLCYAVHFAGLSTVISTAALCLIFCFDAAWTTVLNLMFRRGRIRGKDHYERWIQRRRGQTPRKK